MTTSVSGAFERLMEAAQRSARKLSDADVPPKSLSPTLAGWLVMERLDRVEIFHARNDDDTPPREDEFYDQIWLMTSGELRSARRSDHTTQAGAPIAAYADIAGTRWDGPYSATSRRVGAVQTVTYDTPDGPRADPAERIAAALQLVASWDEAALRYSAGPAGDGAASEIAARWSPAPWPLPVPSPRQQRVALIGLGLMVAAMAWLAADFGAAMGVMLWATPLVLLATVLYGVYKLFEMHTFAGIGALAGAAVILLASWAVYSFVLTIWVDSSAICPKVVQVLPKGDVMCAGDSSLHFNWSPPLFHFGRSIPDPPG